MKMTEAQKDFFEELEGKDKKKKSLFRPQTERKISFSSSFDTLLLGFLILVMGVVIVYAIGVEIGHQQKMRAARQPSVQVSLPPVTKAAPPPREIQGKYTVQVASFTKKETAEQALEKVRKDTAGVTAFLIGSRQIALCIGSYETRAEADRALMEFQKRYRDSFVRNR